MILETTYRNIEVKKRINSAVGKPFSIWQSIQMKGIGCKRMIIGDVSVTIKQYLNTVADINYGNIELRPNGILVTIIKGLQSFTWVIPYYQLYLYKTEGMSIHAQGKFVNFKNNTTLKENASFFKKLTHLKIDYDQRYPHVDSL